MTAKFLELQERNKDGRRILLAPVPIIASVYINGIQWGRLGTPKQAIAKAEMARMVTLYERFGAYFQPMKEGDKGRVWWEIRFRQPSIWKNGPPRQSNEEALMHNYMRNNCFPGRSPLDRGDGTALLKADEHIQDTLARDEAKAEADFHGITSFGIGQKTKG
jgi:hypothetical protein